MTEEIAVVADASATEPTQDWPVAETYLVKPTEGTTGGAPATGDETVVVTQTSAPIATNRRFPAVGPGLFAAIAAAIAAVILTAILLDLRGGDESAAARTTTAASASPRTKAAPTTAPQAATLATRDLQGMSLEEARQLLKEQGLQIKVRRMESDQPPGDVLRQLPRAGTQVERDSVISLVVSAGAAPTVAPKSADVPGVVGLAASDAVAALRVAGFETRVQLVKSTQPAGTVIRQSPEEATEADRGSQVVVNVARGRPTVQKIEVPDLAGLTAATARRMLRSAGFTVVVVTVQSGEPAGQVVGQSPRAGLEIRRGGEVTVRVSSGAAQVDVPDVTGLDEQSATLQLESAGLEVRVTYESTADSAEDGVVLRQSPVAGSMADEGTLVMLVVARLD